MTIREMTAYQVVCDGCGGTAYNMDARYLSWDDPDYANEAWADAGGIAVGGRHACDGPECGRAVLDSLPDLIARSAASGVGRWWVVFDQKWKEYVAFYAWGQYGPVPAQSSRSLATVMDKARAW